MIWEGVLVASAGQVVPVDALLDTLWPDAPPESAAGTLQPYVSRLRRVFGACGRQLVARCRQPAQICAGLAA